MSERRETTRVVAPCVMSGARETLTVEPIGRFGVSFIYGEDASVIVNGENLRRIRSIIDGQIANWEVANGARSAG